MIRDNPFSSKVFTSCWSKHFLNQSTVYSFDFLKGIWFYESKLPRLKINVGKNLTKGMYYEIESSNTKDIKGKTLLIYDVIGFSGKRASIKEKGIGLYSVKQYPGFATDLKGFTSLEDFMSKTFKKSSRYKLRKYKKRLEECFDISFKSFGADISEEEYDFLFERFRILLERRFNEKKIHNNNLNNDEWDFYKDVAFPLIREEKATLFVLYNGDQPISITLGYLADKRIFDAITVFDIDYAKFHLGSVKIMHLINWAITNNWDILDFSKGYFDYKTRWSNQKYHFHYHILFDPKSITSKFLATLLKEYFLLKQFLRDKKINEKLHRLTFWLKNIFRKKRSENVPQYEFIELPEEATKREFEEIAYKEYDNRQFRKMAFDFLYLNNEHYSTLKVYKKIQSDSTVFMFAGKNKRVMAKVLKPIQ